MNNIPQGKGIYLWRIHKLMETYETPEKAARYLVANGFTWVAVKATDGGWLFNLRKLASGLWKDDILMPLVKAMRAQNIKVWFWGFNYGSYPTLEANAINKRLTQYKGLIEGFIFDPESHFKNKEPQAYTLLKRVKAAHPDVPLGCSTFRYPNYHRDFPYRPFLEYCDFQAPQVYWEQAGTRDNPRFQIAETIRQYRNLESEFNIPPKPIVPAGSAYTNKGWLPTAKELETFHEAVEENNLQGMLFWEWTEAIKIDMLGELADMNWNGVIPSDDPIDPVTPMSWGPSIDAWARTMGYEGVEFDSF